MNKQPTPSSPAAQADIRLSCADFTFPLLSHDRSLDLIRDLGFDGVDIGFFEGRSHIQPSLALADAGPAARNLREACEGRGLKIADLFLQPGFELEALTVNHPEAAERERSREIFRRSLDFALDCGAEHLSVLPGVAWDDGDASFERAVEELAWRAELSAREGLPLSCEAHVGSVVASPAGALRLFEAVPDLGLVLDCAHFVVPGYPWEEIEKLIPHAVHAHARGACRDRIQVVAAENTIDFAALVRSLRARHYTGWICAEYVWMQKWDCDRVDNLSETILLRDVLLKALSGSNE